jgi:lysophospholipase L1-like esterase
MRTANSAAAARPRANLTTVLLYFAGGALLCIVFLNAGFAELLNRGELPATTLKRIAKAEVCFLALSAVLFLFASLTTKLSWLNSLTSRKEATGAILFALVLLLPLFVLELALRPFAQFEHKKTTLYLKDPELGWRLRPNAIDVWDGAMIKINAKGLRGPELAYDKSPGMSRILFLGDSVTFGDGLKTFEETFPFLIGQKLTAQLKRPVEVINSGVSGYSPWQEAIYLEKEGLRYHPDFVAVTFVLNDVTEKFELTRFGGTGEGWQLSHNYSSFLEWLSDHSGIANFTRRLSARLRFGSDLQQGAQQQERLEVRSLVDFPERADVQQAWKVTLTEMDRIIDLCRAHEIPLLVIISPYRFQFEEGVTDGLPQKIVGDHARSRGVAVLDLLPDLTAEMKRRGHKPENCLQDSCHFSAFGCQLVAQLVTDYVAGENLFARAGALAGPNPSESGKP